ncbi:Alpha/Beta hydrolase protein [Bombardia bombarda]|uniref:Alpha/Beta hydrolase protein n=1 Tax=Bombardia bombarda TaxID=252184 RepID=A0AA39WAN6_9PEZI|nr:Alpha/Beta hydrolase protein [Bombardia bombarda]
MSSKQPHPPSDNKTSSGLEMADSDYKYLAKPPSACCFAGTIHKGTPRGNVEEILNVPTYVVKPSEEKANGHVVLYFPDVWGISNNACLLLDGFADAGYLALGMDYFRGDPISKYRLSKNDPLPEGFDQAAWRTKHVAFATENVPKWAAAVREKFGSDKTKYVCVGYCFGAPYVCQMLATDEVSAGAFAHPTLLREEHFTSVKHPLLLSCAEHDHAFDTEARRKAIDILQREKKVYHLQLFYGVSHGFASKGDPDNPYQRWCKEQSLRGIIDWFDLWLVKS